MGEHYDAVGIYNFVGDTEGFAVSGFGFYFYF